MKGNLLSSLYEYYTLNFGYLMELFFKHLLMSIYGVLFACIGIPIRILISRYTSYHGLLLLSRILSDSSSNRDVSNIC